MSADVKELEKRMHGAMDALKKEFAGLRTGRASVNLLDPVVVEAYGQRMSLNQVGTVSAPEPRLLTVSVWDKGLVVSTAKAIREAGRDGVIPIELVDGEKLVKIFEDLELGVKPKTIYEVDHAFFEPFKTDGPKPQK